MESNSKTLLQELKKQEDQLNQLQMDYTQARFQLDQERMQLEDKQVLFQQVLEEEYAAVASFLYKHEEAIDGQWQEVQSYFESLEEVAKEASQKEMRILEDREDNLWKDYRLEENKIQTSLEEARKQVRYLG